MSSSTAAVAVPPGSPEPAVVSTAQGAIRGSVLDDHRVFQGVPFATPPVGPLRWQPPQPAASWTGVRDATQPASPCAQAPVPVLPGRSNQTGSRSEDCLYLNVWTPAAQAPRGRPVFVWLHGGSNVSGAGSDYDPTDLVVRGDVIVVTVNYRLGAFGFLAHPALSAESADRASGDYGLMDQQAALRWVQANIAAFGGDRHRVTVGGESAGSTDTCAHIASPTAAGLFVRAIQESGSCVAGGGFSPPTLLAASAAGLAFGTGLGCADAACLRAVSVDRLIAAEAARSWGPNTGPAILPISPAAAWATGRVRPVPVLTGSNHDEYRFFTSVFIDFVSGPLTAQSYPARVRQEFPGAADAILAEYPAAAYPSPNIAYSALKTDQIFACPARADAMLYSGHTAVFEYEFNDPQAPPFVQDPNLPQGAFHAGELAYLFRGATLTPAQQRLSEEMIGFWSRFIATGDPNDHGRPSWPRYRAASDLIQVLAPDATAPTQGFAADHHCPFWQTIAGIPA
ncbi:MAG TPA: carboxylesterase family protein [Micromonosporaceae bacterium]|nr:carboxylesterase family protein [Micromonosporaceae bacterium]